ncbi:hypothetical protein EV356DRAFT_532226 [Viridothelium virens]|uniref:Rhodopsin domain-containing protein n=1 Tax=Viridothelium virens TaxID=1048519 RepID=A0A6A6HB10_VIRVR|nr:hypothetical protein EV356DRAFT_532226 [Viridothelium virens]
MDSSTNLDNYANPSANLVVATLLPILGTFAVTARFSLQIAKKLPLRADDWLCLPALVFVWACGGVVIWGVDHQSIGHHTILNAQGMSDTSNPAYNTQMFFSHKLVFIFNILAYPALCFTKLSILFFYRRIFRGNIFNIITWSLIGVVISWTVLYELIWAFSCRTHFSFWWGTIQQVHDFCLNIFNEMIAGSAIDFILDIGILFLPAVKIWQLQMPTRQKIMVLGVFLTGLLSVISGILRFVATLALADFGLMGFEVIEHQLNPDALLNHAGVTLGVSSTDWMGMVTIHIFWTMVEVGVALIAICLPLFRPGTLLRKNHWIQRWLGSFSTRLSRSRRSAHHSHRHAPPGAGRSKHIPLVSSEDEAEKSLSKSANSNTDYQMRIDPTQDVELQERDFKDRYEQLFPTTTATVETIPSRVV